MTRSERSPIEVAGRVQRGIERFYSLEQAPFIGAFMRATSEGERERVVIRDADDGDIEIEVVAPALLPDPGLDDVCQLIEGVSHFVHVADRARRNLPTTHLELELQAEVDKYVLLVLDSDTFDPGSARSMHARLYERVRFRDAEGTEEGERYRLANDFGGPLRASPRGALCRKGATFRASLGALSVLCDGPGRQNRLRARRITREAFAPRWEPRREGRLRHGSAMRKTSGCHRRRRVGGGA